MAGGTVEFRQTEYETGDLLKADFTWSGGVWNFSAEAYATLSIYDPDGEIKAHYVEENDNEGSYTLECYGDSEGQWRARIRIWNGSSWTDLSHYTTVLSEPTPPPPPPPPPDDEHNWRFNTVPFKCLITIEGYGSGTSSSTGYYMFPDVPEGVYNWSVSKTGYITKSGEHNLVAAKISNVALEVEPPPPETYTLTVKTIPTYCHVEVDDRWVTNSGDDAIAVFPNLAEGNHTIVVSKSGLDPRTVTIDLIEEREITVNISDAPDFWKDPIAWIQYFVITTFDTMLQWQGGTFVSLLHNIKEFFDNSWSSISTFFADVPGNVQAAMSGTITGIQSWLDGTFNNIGEWWDSTASGIGEWWNSTTQEMGEWWTSVSGDIGNWWTGSWEDISAAISTATEGFLSWGEDLLTDIWEGIQDWVVDLITGLIESFNSGFDQGIEDQKTERGYNEE